jgi:hypothetical protein
VLFDERFSSTIATTWKLHRDNLALRPINSDIPTVSTTLEHTGGVDSNASIEEGEKQHQSKTVETPISDPSTDPDDVPDLSPQDDDSDASDAEYEDDDSDADSLDNNDILEMEQPSIPYETDISPQPIEPTLRRSTRARKPNPRYANQVKHFEWEKEYEDTEYEELARACAAEANPGLPNRKDALSWEPAPSSIRDILKMPDGIVRREWLKSVKKEIKTLVDCNTFLDDTMVPGEISTPVMDTYKVKIKSDGSLDKLKTRLVVRGDLQDKNITEDKWSPTASFRSLKMFLAHASRSKVRVKQLDFIGAFLQAKMRTRMFVTIPKIFGILFPEYARYTGKPMRLIMSMYGTTLCGKYWYLDLLDFLKEIEFKEGNCVKCSFIREFSDGAKIHLLNYVDDMLYYGTDDEKVKAFEKQLADRFSLELLGQAHWYLGSRIRQLANYDIELDQSRYCKSIVRKYLETAGCAKNLRQHDTPLPSGFIPMADDCSAKEEDAKELEVQYNIDFASCVGSLIYLGMTRTDILYAVNKLAKYTRRPGRNHFEAILHLLRYLCDNTLYGVRFYSEIGESPIYQMLLGQNIQEKHLFFGFTDSSWNDDVDTGRSTGCFIITYMGGIVDHSSNMPDPVALSSAEAEYNEGCVAFMAASHLRMLLCEMENISEENMAATTIYFDSKSAIAMGANYKDTKHTRHIMRRYHYVRENIAAKRFTTQWIGTEFQISDIGTKLNDGPRHKTLMEMILIKVKDQSVNNTLVQEG